MVFKDYIALKNTEQYDNKVQELIASMLILKGSDHGRARTELQQKYVFGTMTDDLYPTTEENVISLLDTFARINNNNDNSNNISNNDNHDAVVAAHDASQEYHSDDDKGCDDESLVSYASEEQKEADATLLVNINESPTNEAGFRAMILANAVAKYENGISEIEDNFINRNDNTDHQDLSGAFDDNEHDALACAHVVVIDGDDDNNEDFTVGDDPNNDDNNNNNNSNNDNNDIDDEPIGHFSERTLCVTRDKVTAVYAVVVVVINKKFKASNHVHTINNIIEYADALICKFNNLGLASARELYLALENGPNRINNMLAEAGYFKLHLSTINLLCKESFRTSNCTERQSICWYNDTITMTGDDDGVNFTDFPEIRAVIKATATSQGQHVPIRWVNNVTAKLASSGIMSILKLRDAINRGTINTIIARKGKPGFNNITINGIQSALEFSQDFQQGRS
jgi:hypothetical protein